MSAGFQVIMLKERETDKTARCYGLYETGYWGTGWRLVLIVESAVRGMVRWGGRCDERCDDERAKQPVLLVFRNRAGFGQDSIFKPQGLPFVPIVPCWLMT